MHVWIPFVFFCIHSIHERICNLGTMFICFFARSRALSTHVLFLCFFVCLHGHRHCSCMSWFHLLFFCLHGVNACVSSFVFFLRARTLCMYVCIWVCACVRARVRACVFVFLCAHTHPESSPLPTTHTPMPTQTHPQAHSPPLACLCTGPDSAIPTHAILTPTVHSHAHAQAQDPSPRPLPIPLAVPEPISTPTPCRRAGAKPIPTHPQAYSHALAQGRDQTSPHVHSHHIHSSRVTGHPHSHTYHSLNHSCIHSNSTHTHKLSRLRAPHTHPHTHVHPYSHTYAQTRVHA